MKSALVLMAFVFAIGVSAAETRWRFAIEETAGGVQHAVAERFAERVSELSGGEVSVTVYPYGTLGTSDQVTELLAMGTIQFAMASPGHLGKIIPEVQALLLHFILTDDEAVNGRILADPEVVGLFDELYREKGLSALSIFSEGWLAWTTKAPVARPEDFRGVRMRTMTSPLLLAAYEAYGANPTPLPYGEVYGALQLNMIDGQENPIFAIKEMSFHEVVNHIVFGKHAPFVATMATNAAFLDRLAPETRAMVAGVVEELGPFTLATQQSHNAKQLAAIRSDRPELEIVEAIAPESRDAFRKASLTVRERYLELAGPRGAVMLETLERARLRARAGEIE